THAVALPVGACPFRLDRRLDAVEFRQHSGVVGGPGAPAGDDRRQAFELLAPDRCLDVGHPVIVAANGIAFEDDLCAAVAQGVGHRHAVLSQQPEERVPLRVAGGDHAAVPDGDDLAWVEGEARDVCVRAADAIPGGVRPYLGTDGASRVLYDRDVGAPCNLQDGGEVTGHAHLV